MLLQKNISRAISFVKNVKRYSPACEIINDLILSFQKYIKYVEKSQSELEMDNFQMTLFKEENERLKRILKLYDGNENFTNEEIDILEAIKEPTQFYVSDIASLTLLKYRFVDIILKAKMPKKTTRPENLDHLTQSYNILINKYGNPKN